MNERIKELRKNCGLSQLEVATQIGCSQNTISKIEKGDTQPPRRHFKGNMRILSCVR